MGDGGLLFGARVGIAVVRRLGWVRIGRVFSPFLLSSLSSFSSLGWVFLLLATGFESLVYALLPL